MMEPRWLSEKEQLAWRSLNWMHDDLVDFIDRRLRMRSGISSADYQVLIHLSEAPDGRLRSLDLGRLLRWEKSRLSQHLTRMEKRGLLSREACPSDQRGIDVVVTPAGRDTIREAAPHHVEDVRSALIDHLTPGELADLSAIAQKIQARLAELGEEDGR
jgi:DNA-binding MarR family transcriptional regulator